MKYSLIKQYDDSTINNIMEYDSIKVGKYGIRFNPYKLVNEICIGKSYRDEYEHYYKFVKILLTGKVLEIYSDGIKNEGICDSIIYTVEQSFHMDDMDYFGFDYIQILLDNNDDYIVCDDDDILIVNIDPKIFKETRKYNL